VKIDLSAPPHDGASIGLAFATGGCAAVAAHFSANPISADDCIEFGGTSYVVTGVRITCDGSLVHSDGVEGGAHDKTHDYAPSPVVITFWLRAAEPGECP